MDAGVRIRFDDWSDENPIPVICSHGLTAPSHTVPYGTVLWREAFPGTSCQATIASFVLPTPPFNHLNNIFIDCYIYLLKIAASQWIRTKP
jgi:hypothetical protein